MGVMRFGRWVFGWLLLLSFTARAESPAYITFPSDIQWMTKDNSHFRILYRQGEDRLADRVLAAAEKAHDLLAPVFAEVPPKTWIVLADFHDSLNGYAIDFPFPHMVIFAAPPEPAGALAELDGWLSSVVLHEYVHVLHLYPANGMWSLLRSVFGAWVLPNGLMPSHLHEGLATFFETEFTRGGRGRGASFAMYRRMAVKEGVWGNQFVPLDLLEGSIRWPQGSSPYFFGYHLYRELWNRKKTEGIRAFVEKTSRAFPYLINGPVESIYGADYPSLWADIFKKTGETTAREIKDIESRPLSDLKYLTDTHYYKWDLMASPDGSLLAYRKAHPDTGSSLEILSTRSEKENRSITLEGGRQEGGCWAQRGGKNFLVYAETESNNGYLLNAARVLNLETEASTRALHQDAPVTHVQTFACGADGKVFTYQETSGHGFVREWATSQDWKDWTLVREWPVPEGDWVSSIAAANPPLIAVRRPVSTALYRWTNGAEPKKFWELAGHFYRFSPPKESGEWPAVTSVSGREEVWMLHPEKKWARKVVSVMGGVNSFAERNGKWWVSSYRHGGYDVAEAKTIHSEPEKLKEFEPERESASSVTTSTGKPYSAWSTLAPRAWIPSIFVVPDGVQFAAWIPGFDVSQRHVYNLFGGYDTRGSPFLIGSYGYRFGLNYQLLVDANFLPSYLISSRAFLKQWGASVGLSTRLGRDLPTVTASIIYKKVEPSRLGPGTPSVGFGLGVSHSFWVKTAARAIAPLRATQVSVNHSQFFKALGSGDNYYATSAGIDQWLQTPWYGRHIIKLGARLGYTQGTALYNSFFQGGGELIFSQGRGFFLNRGFVPGIFSSQKILTFNFDYLLPLVEVERGWNQYPFFLKRLDAALVADVTTIGRFRYYYASAGVELKSNWKLFYYLPTVLRLGAYHGFGPYGEPLYVTFAMEASLF